MGRLIREDDVMRMLTGVELNNGTITDAKIELRNVKTAYDISKVVAELNEATIKIAQKYLDMVDGKEVQSIATYNEFVIALLNRIMKQIRKGGVE